MSTEETAIERIEKKLDRIETALYGTGNPHGGFLFQQFSVLEGKVTVLDAKIDSVESKLEAKFDKMFGFAKLVVSIAAVPFYAVVIPISIQVALPIIRGWMSGRQVCV